MLLMMSMCIIHGLDVSKVIAQVLSFTSINLRAYTGLRDLF